MQIGPTKAADKREEAESKQFIYGSLSTLTE